MIMLSFRTLSVNPIVRCREENIEYCSDENAERYSGEKCRTVRRGYHKLSSRIMNQLGMALGVLFLIRLISGKELEQ